MNKENKNVMITINKWKKMTINKKKKKKTW